MKTLVIMGAGEGLGLSLAKRFGKENFQVALVSRDTQKLQRLVNTLKENDIEASFFRADIYKKEQIENAIDAIKEKYGQIDVLEFSPTPGNYPPTAVLELTAENVMNIFEGHVPSAINTVNTVLPDMLKRGEGTLMFTTGLSAVYPIPMLANVGIALSGLRNYLTNLHSELEPKGIRVMHRSLGLFMKAGTGEVNDPEVIADMWYHVYNERRDWEDVYPEGVTPEKIVGL
jgi:NADP-dependent 3-hydroxy acid dehydrogenase YdfG